MTAKEVWYSWDGNTERDMGFRKYVPDFYTLVIENGKQVVSNSQRYRMLGNGWTVDVIAHIYSYLENKKD